jgi:hypothetical protein
MTTAVVMTYDSPVLNVQTYLERTDATTLAYIPTFIMLAEQVIAAQIKFLGNLNVAESTMVTGSNVLAKPDRWHKTVSMNVTVSGAKQPVLLRKYEYLINYNQNSSTTGAPLYYADTSWDWWYISPTPDQAYTFEVLYYERIAPLSSTNQTNWLTQNAPTAMLYGTLLQAMPFLKNDQRQIFQQKYTEAITSLKSEDVSRVADRQAIAVDS